MKPHEINDMNNFMGAWFIDESDLCGEIIKCHQNDPNKSQGMCSMGGDPTVNVSVKNSIDSFLFGETKEKYFQKILNPCTREYIKMYSYCDFYAAWNVSELINIQYYSPNNAFNSWHCERGQYSEKTLKRHLVFMTYLNDVEDGGETEFYYQKLKIKPKKGLTVIWPSDWTFTHRGLPSSSQEKYIVTGWFSYYDRNAGFV